MAVTLRIKDYFTFSELMARWNCSEHELSYAIIAGDIKPCVKLKIGSAALTWEIDDFGEFLPIERVPEEPTSVLSRPNAWRYLQDPIQTHPFDCEFSFCHKIRDPKILEPDAWWFKLPTPMSIEDVKNNAVFLFREIGAYERANGSKATAVKDDKPLQTTERNSLLVMIAALCDYSNIKYESRGAAHQISKLTEEIGALVTDDTIRKALKQIPNALETRMRIPLPNSAIPKPNSAT